MSKDTETVSKDTETVPESRAINVDFSTGGIKIEMDGGVTPDEMILAAHYIGRTADQVLDAQQAQRHAEQEHRPALAIARAMPNPARNGA